MSGQDGCVFPRGENLAHGGFSTGFNCRPDRAGSGFHPKTAQRGQATQARAKAPALLFRPPEKHASRPVSAADQVDRSAPKRLTGELSAYLARVLLPPARG